MIEKYHTQFENKNFSKIEKKCEEFEIPQTERIGFINFTEAELFPVEFRKKYIEPLRLSLNSFLSENGFSFYKGGSLRKNFYEFDLVSVLMEPVVKIKNPYIDFYESILEDLLQVMNSNYKGIFDRRGNTLRFFRENGDTIVVSY